MALKYWFVFAAVLYAQQWLSTTCEEQEQSAGSAPTLENMTVTTDVYDYDYNDTGCGYSVLNSTDGLLAVNCTLECSPPMLMNDSVLCVYGTNTPYGEMQQGKNYTCQEGKCENGTCIPIHKNDTCWLPPPPVYHFFNATTTTPSSEDNGQLGATS
uniref:Evasin n=1 Tax=Rhipicephalus appendiculatus TaxID=34631 RepID=A0A131Z5R5_RHIAP